MAVCLLQPQSLYKGISYAPLCFYVSDNRLFLGVVVHTFNRSTLEYEATPGCSVSSKPARDRGYIVRLFLKNETGCWRESTVVIKTLVALAKDRV